MSSNKGGSLELEIERILTSPDTSPDCAKEGAAKEIIVVKEKKGGCKHTHACKVFKANGATEEYKSEFCVNPQFVCTKCGRCGQRAEQVCHPAPLPLPK